MKVAENLHVASSRYWESFPCFKSWGMGTSLHTSKKIQSKAVTQPFLTIGWVCSVFRVFRKFCLECFECLECFCSEFAVFLKRVCTAFFSGFVTRVSQHGTSRGHYARDRHRVPGSALDWSIFVRACARAPPLKWSPTPGSYLHRVSSSKVRYRGRFDKSYLIAWRVSKIATVRT